MNTSEDLRYRPVVAFDVDGVLRIYRPDATDVDKIELEVTLLEAEYPDIYHGKPKWDSTGTLDTVEHFSKEGIDLVRHLQAENTSDTVLATTWQRWANLYFIEPLNLEPMSVAVKTLEPFEWNYAHCSPAWKTKQLSRQFDGRPLIWIDDNMPDRYGEELSVLRRPEDRYLTASYKTDTYNGITQEDADFIKEWLKLASTPEGHAKLQAIEDERIRKEEEEALKLHELIKLEESIYAETLRRAKILFPNNHYLVNNLATLSRHRTGLTVETIELALKRNTEVADAKEVSYQLRWGDYHYMTLDDVPDFESDQ